MAALSWVGQTLYGGSAWSGGTTFGQLWEVNPNSGALTAVGTTSASNSIIHGMATIGTTLYGSWSSLFTIDTTTGAQSNVASFSGDTIVVRGMEYVSATGTLYGVSGGTDLYTINPTTAQTTLIGSGVNSLESLGWYNGTLYGGNSLGELYSIDTSNGVQTAVGVPGTYGMAGMAVAPEPISSTLFLIGGATLGFRRFIRKRQEV